MSLQISDLPTALDPSGRSENAKVTIHAAKLHRFSHRVKARKNGFKTFLKSYLDFYTQSFSKTMSGLFDIKN